MVGVATTDLGKPHLAGGLTQECLVSCIRANSINGPCIYGTGSIHHTGSDVTKQKAASLGRGLPEIKFIFT